MDERRITILRAIRFHDGLSITEYQNLLAMTNRHKENVKRFNYLFIRDVIFEFQKLGIVIVEKAGRDKRVKLTNKGEIIFDKIEELNDILQGVEIEKKENNNQIKQKVFTEV